MASEINGRLTGKHILLGYKINIHERDTPVAIYSVLSFLLSSMQFHIIV